MKILLLGAGETGKSTILKQLQLLYQQELDAKFYRQVGACVPLASRPHKASTYRMAEAEF